MEKERQRNGRSQEKKGKGWKRVKKEDGRRERSFAIKEKIRVYYAAVRNLCSFYGEKAWTFRWTENITSSWYGGRTKRSF